MDGKYRAICTDFGLMDAGIAENTQHEDCETLAEAHRSLRRLSQVAMAFQHGDLWLSIVTPDHSTVYDSRVTF